MTIDINPSVNIIKRFNVTARYKNVFPVNHVIKLNPTMFDLNSMRVNTTINTIPKVTYRDLLEE